MSAEDEAAIQEAIEGKDGESKEVAEENVEETELEGVQPKVARDPGQPSKEDIARHRAAGHVSYRAWCACCVRGRGRDRKHKLCAPIHPGGPVVPKVAIDYCFLTEKGLVKEAEIEDEERQDERRSQTILVMKDYVYQSIWAYPVSKKGEQDETWIVQQLAEDLKRSGSTISI